MKVIIALAVFVAVAVAAPQKESDAVVTKYASDNIGVGGYSYEYETSNRIAAQERGQIINEGRENEAVVAQGQFSYIGPDGVQYAVQYVADENGFQPSGAHLPVAP